MAAPAERQLPRRQIVSYSIAGVGITAMSFINALYLFKYGTDILLIAPGAMGVLYSISRIWDAISDPLVGRWSDRTRSRFGRRIVWIYASIPVTAFTFVMLWAPPQSLGDYGLRVWMGVALVAYSTAVTMFQVPHYALGVEMTEGHHERTRVFSFRQLLGGAGLLLGLGTFFLLVDAENPREIALPLSLSLAVVAGLLTGIGVAPLRERPDHQGRGGEDIRKAFWDVFRNPHARLLLLMYGIESFGAATTGILSVFITHYIVKAPQAFYIVILLCYVIPSFVLAPLWNRLSRRTGKRQLWLVAMSIAAVAYTAHSFLGEGMLIFWGCISAIQGATAGVGNVIGPSIKADVIDYDEWKTGERKEGAYLAVWTFVQKTAGGLCAILLGFSLQLSGFEPNAEQSQTTQWTILALYGALPGACYAVGTWLLFRFRLDASEHARIRAELDARKAAEA